MLGFALICHCHVRAQSSGELSQWQVSLDQGLIFQPTQVPGAIEDQIDVEFDGRSIYRTKLPNLTVGEHQRLLLHFQAVATDATVYLGDQPAGRHLGGWTPFTIDLTSEYLAVNRNPEQAAWLRVEVDEKVGHNTQGFLPVITNHFGGIWQPVRWELTGGTVLLQEAIAVLADFDNRQLSIEFPVLQANSDGHAWAYSIRPLKSHGNEPDGQWESLPVISSGRNKADTSHIESMEAGDAEYVYSATVAAPAMLKRWSPDSPHRYEIRVQLESAPDAESEYGRQGSDSNSACVKMGFRTFDVDGDQFRLNEKPIAIRGLLNWGYAPPLVAPSLEEQWMIDEIRFAQLRGFNLMKFCLWVPPQRYLELCDQMGMLTWMEYPTWHPQLDQNHVAELQREYAEFHEYDRVHCSIVLRSLTCETGPGADLDVVKSLYDQCKRYVPDAVLEDDSSWIEWNRVHDFYDDHPYGNNHTWVSTLKRLQEYVAERRLLPLVLGEAIAADTWTAPTDHAIALASEHPAHGALSVADALRWQAEIGLIAEKRNRTFEAASLLPQSRHYGMLMRKFQIEAYRREVPQGGYVISVIRDFPKAAMGLINFDNQPKHTPEDWAFQDSRMLILSTENDRRSFDGGTSTPLGLLLKNGSQDRVEKGQLYLSLRDSLGNSNSQTVMEVDAVVAGSSLHMKSTVTLPSVNAPTRLILKATWSAGEFRGINEWPVWVFPNSPSENPKFVVHPSAESLVDELPITALSWKSDTTDSRGLHDTPILARHFDHELLDRLTTGRRVVMIPDGESGSFPLSEHWFLRGAPVVLPRTAETWQQPFSLERAGESESQNMLMELQHFDLAGPVVADIDHYLSLVDPTLILWDNHDLARVKTHGLVFEMAVGRGRLLVTALKHSGRTNSAGRWLFREFRQQVMRGDSAMGAEAGIETRIRLDAEINRRSVLLHEDPWKFQPDPEGIGTGQRWFEPGFDDSRWSEIRVDQHWEGQGHDGLDHWAWYRRSIRLADDWKSPTTFLNFTGIDDYAVIYVNGIKIGTAGDLESKRTAFDDRISLDVSRFAGPGELLQISVAVFDWYGAGGIFRPVTLSTEPLSENPPILK